MKSVVVAFWLVLFCCQVQAVPWQENPKVAALFAAAGVKGTFVLYDVKSARAIGHDQTRAETRFIPASTFKIPNSLIGLSVGAVQSVAEPLPYGGQPQPYKQWERDMGLNEAIAMSNVPIYKELARRIGIERMRKGVALLEYGNQQIGDTVDTFWLQGPLEISAVEQTQFLARLAQGTLPMESKVQQEVRGIVLLEQTPQWKLYGKTGWQNAPGAGVGWWVGWVERGGDIYSFALNMEMREQADADKRVQLGKASLQAVGVL